MTISNKIDIFCAYFEREASAINSISIPDSQDEEIGAGVQLRYKKTLYVTAIDTLAGLRFHKAAYPTLARRNRDRFIRFLTEFGAWSEGSLVSLPFLKDELESSRLISKPLGKHVVEKLSKFNTEDGGVVPVSKMDEPSHSLLALATAEKEEEAISEYQHFALFYRYRNTLVHDSRQPGKAMEGIFSSDEPSYHGYIGDERWYLMYPVSLFESLLMHSIAGFKTYLVSNQIDPFSLIEDKARW